MKAARFLVLLAFASASMAAERSRFATEASNSSTFQLLPKSFQRHPVLDFHVITELTPEGRKAAPATNDHPVYYIEQAGKFAQMGNNTPGGEEPPKVEDLQRAMRDALESSHFIPATPKTALPNLVVVFNYGSFARFSTDMFDFEESQAMADAFPDAPPFLRVDGDRDTESLLAIVLEHRAERDDILKRAALIGGDKFAQELGGVLKEEAAYRAAASMSGAARFDTSGPFRLFVNSNQAKMDLVEESFSGCYFVVASAYDYRALKAGQRVLLWRTKMTVNSSGISMTESLPALVVAAGPYLGREMTEAVTLSRRISRTGKVQVGSPEVIEFSDQPMGSRDRREADAPRKP